MILLGKRKKNSKEEIEQNVTDKTQENKNKQEMVLYILTEKNIKSMNEYFCSNGVRVSNIFTSIEDANIAMILENKQTRLVVTESGLGRFIGVTARKNLIDLMGLCDGKDKKLTIFYTNSLIKADAAKVLGKKCKEIQWVNYTSTVDVLNSIKKMNENYTGNEHYKAEELLENELINFTGSYINTDKVNVINTSIGDDTLYNFRKNIDTESIPGYEVVI